MNLKRFIAVSKIVTFGHILNWPWRSRDTRRRVRVGIITDVIPAYFNKYLPASAAVKQVPVVQNDESEKIYTIWLQGEDAAPELVKTCARSVRRHCTQEFVILDEKSLFNQIDLPGVIMDKRRRGIIKNAHFADIARIELLHNNGGIWLDATAFVSSPVPKEFIKQDYFMYMAGNIAGSPYSYVQNCFIRARKGAYLLEAWRAMILEYWKNEPREFDYFMHQLMFKTLVQGDPRAIEMFAKMPQLDQGPTHALWWGNYNKPFDRATFDKITSGAFFQKTTYRGTDNPIPGSLADVILKM